MLLSSLTLSAQEKVRELVSADYDRASISLIFVDRGNLTGDVAKFYKQIGLPAKFDVNKISTKLFTRACLKNGTITDVEHMTAYVNNANIGNEVISYIYNRKSDGTFDDSLIKERAKYNATDQDIRNIEAAKVKDQWLEMGEKLVESSYIIVYDISDITSRVNSSGQISYRAQTNAMVFKINADKNVIYDFYMNGWADDTYSPEDKARAKIAFDLMKFDMEFVASATGKGSSSSTSSSNATIYEACMDAHEDLFINLEKQISKWQVATSVVSIHPIAAKIGTKENVQNADRYAVYAYRENKDGELISVKRGMVRATVVSNNDGIATGNTEPTYFYQISGGLNVREGYTLVEKKDSKFGGSISAGMTPAGIRVGLDMDFIAHISKRGCITYPLINIGLDFGKETNLDGSLGLGFGMPISRYFEFMPYATLGGYYSIDADKLSAYFIEPGVRAAITIQPLSIYVGLGYDVCLGTRLKSGVVLKGGIKWTF